MYMVQYKDWFFQRKKTNVVSVIFLFISFYFIFMGPFNLASGVVAEATVRIDVPNCVLAGSYCSSIRLLNSFLENGGALENRHTWNTPACSELLDRQVVSFHTIGPPLFLFHC